MKIAKGWRQIAWEEKLKKEGLSFNEIQRTINSIFMKREKFILDTAVYDKVATHQYRIPVYTILTNKGIKLIEEVYTDYPSDVEIPADHVYLQFVKGSKVQEENTSYSLDGILTEQLIAVCIDHLKTVNVGDLANRETSMAITKLEEAFLWLAKRTLERQNNGKFGTYKP